MKTQLRFFTSLIVLMIATMGFGLFQQPWTAPEKFTKMANPVKSDAASLKTGKEIWSKHCQSCHGKSGLGNGTKAAQLKTEVASFSDSKIQGQSDGSMYYKTSEGRDDMPAFKKKIPDQEEIWSVINYIRTFKK